MLKLLFTRTKSSSVVYNPNQMKIYISNMLQLIHPSIRLHFWTTSTESPGPNFFKPCELSLLLKGDWKFVQMVTVRKSRWPLSLNQDTGICLEEVGNILLPPPFRCPSMHLSTFCYSKSWSVYSWSSLFKDNYCTVWVFIASLDSYTGFSLMVILAVFTPKPCSGPLKVRGKGPEWCIHNQIQNCM